MKKLLPRFGLSILALLAAGGLILFFSPKPPLLAGMSFSNALFDDHGKLLRLTLSHDDKYRLFTSLENISPTLIQTTLLQEDQYFYWHMGVNPFSLWKAIWHTYVLKSRRIGASTITMQLARIRFGITS